MRRPSWLFGAGLTVRLWRLVVCSWVVQLLCLAPALAILELSLGRSLDRLPAAVADGELVLVAIDALAPVRGLLVVAGLAAAVAIWVWSVLWRAAVVSWRIWSEETTPRLTALLGLGVVNAWPYARLAVASVALHGLVQLALWLPLSLLIRARHEAMDERGLSLLLWTGVVVAPVLLLLVWSASLRAAWLLGRADRRSAILALLRGLGDSLRRPVASLLTLLGWAVPSWLGALAPVLVGLALPSARTGLPALAVTGLGGLLAAAAAVALLTAFAPTSGLVTRPGSR